MKRDFLGNVSHIKQLSEFASEGSTNPTIWMDTVKFMQEVCLLPV